MSERDGSSPERKDPAEYFRDREKKGPGAGALAGFGLQFAVALLLFLYLGQWLDRKLGTAPVFLLIGVFVGAGGAFYSMYRKLMAMQAEEDRMKKEEKARRGLQ
jgi:F0F1-type ATP synthase assembly protein I